MNVVGLGGTPNKQKSLFVYTEALLATTKKYNNFFVFRNFFSLKNVIALEKEWEYNYKKQVVMLLKHDEQNKFWGST